MKSDDIIVIVKQDKTSTRDYNCVITEDLDIMSDRRNAKEWEKHYIYIETGDLQSFYNHKPFDLAIRVPGGTVGTISLDENAIITAIHVDTNYVVTNYWRHVNKHLQKYVGGKVTIIDIVEEEKKEEPVVEEKPVEKVNGNTIAYVGNPLFGLVSAMRELHGIYGPTMYLDESVGDNDTIKKIEEN